MYVFIIIIIWNTWNINSNFSLNIMRNNWKLAINILLGDAYITHILLQRPTRRWNILSQLTNRTVTGETNKMGGKGHGGFMSFMEHLYYVRLSYHSSVRRFWQYTSQSSRSVTSVKREVTALDDREGLAGRLG